MHRTQIYLHDSLHARLKIRAKTSGVSMSELIRRTLDSEISSDPTGEAVAFFERLKPLASFSEPQHVEANSAIQTPEAYVRELRARSRLLRMTQSASE